MKFQLDDEYVASCRKAWKVDNLEECRNLIIEKRCGWDGRLCKESKRKILPSVYPMILGFVWRKYLEIAKRDVQNYTFSLPKLIHLKLRWKEYSVLAHQGWPIFQQTVHLTALCRGEFDRRLGKLTSEMLRPTMHFFQDFFNFLGRVVAVYGRGNGRYDHDPTGGLQCRKKRQPMPSFFWAAVLENGTEKESLSRFP